MALSNKASILAIKKEVSEGVPVKPSSASDFVALQDGFSMEPNFQTLENRELKASIAKAKPTLGREQPKAPFQHYLRHSGVEGQAPNYRLLLEALFGEEVVKGTQYNTAASSTAQLIKVGSGNGANFQRGQAVLVKDGVNGYSIRPIHSIATDDLTPAFPLPGAPGTGVGLGKAVIYTPKNSGHPTLSLWEYKANGGAIQMMSGVRVTEGSWEFQAGEQINGTFNFDGVQFYYNPFIIASTNCKVDFLDNATTRAASVPLAVYKDPHDLAAAIQDAMNGLGSTNTFTVKYSDTTGKYSFTSNGTTFSLLWNSGANSANSIGSTIGATSVDQTSALTYTLVNPIDLTAGITPSYDTADPLVAKSNEVLLGDGDAINLIKASRVSVSINNSRKEIEDVTANSGVSGSVITVRESKFSFITILDKYDVDKFKRFREGQTTRFLYNFGVKAGGNWKPGRCGSFYVPNATITSFKLNDDEGLITLECELAAFPDDSGNPEIYLSFV